ncbi:MAM and LDL-receptor class A domain-containing protein 1-like [Anneissia japonica]|uniref:MAM and LDL-receptor class A domain-containing protein 1-like n=1 Tax=Anneissia japonica TaxID=1529436 RepID=UPI001425AE6D|nr:MAM and LDL-receptor class A domain-containing protein 1-like [Anneissia japonica]
MVILVAKVNLLLVQAHSVSLPNVVAAFPIQYVYSVLHQEKDYLTIKENFQHAFLKQVISCCSPLLECEISPASSANNSSLTRTVEILVLNFSLERLKSFPVERVCSCLKENIMSLVDLFARKPHWDSGYMHSATCCNRCAMTFAIAFPVIFKKTCDVDCLNGGVCVSDYGNENCQCVSGFFGPTCNISKNQCDFEDPHICYFEQDKYDDFDWIRTSGSTRTSATGPAYDHTYGTLQGSYMYIETSYGRYNQTARLWTLSYPATNGTCVMWFYHMYGATANTMNVYLVNKEGTVGAPAWTNRNNQGNIWRLGKLSVETKSAFQIVFEGIVGSGNTGDIALDDVRIIDGACLRNETCDIDCLNGGVCVSDYGIENCQCMPGFFGPTCNISQNQCDFEDPHICYFVQDEDDDLDWIRASGSTYIYDAGPAYDHTYGTLQGSYMYVKDSYGRYNKTARLWTTSYPATNGTCIKWFYHMYGERVNTLNTLNVYIVNTESTVGAPAWVNSNNQGNFWRLGKLSVETKTSFQIVFEGIAGSGNTGDIALDDVRIIDGACLRNGKIHFNKYYFRH